MRNLYPSLDPVPYSQEFKIRVAQNDTKVGELRNQSDEKWLTMSAGNANESTIFGAFDESLEDLGFARSMQLQGGNCFVPIDGQARINQQIQESSNLGQGVGKIIHRFNQTVEAKIVCKCCDNIAQPFPSVDLRSVLQDPG